MRTTMGAIFTAICLSVMRSSSSIGVTKAPLPMNFGATMVIAVMVAMKATASISPGITPARNMSPTDCSAMKA